jgi:hypothetical protein
MVSCPFCGAAETDRFDLEGRRFLVFGCMFTPEVDPRWSEDELARELGRRYRADGSGAYFRHMCDRLHLYVTAGEGGRALRGDRGEGTEGSGP